MYKINLKKINTTLRSHGTKDKAARRQIRDIYVSASSSACFAFTDLLWTVNASESTA